MLWLKMVKSSDDNFCYTRELFYDSLFMFYDAIICVLGWNVLKFYNVLIVFQDGMYNLI